MAPINTSVVKPPAWTGKAGEMAIVVSWGEPRRTDIQMEQVVAEQMRNYLLHFTNAKPSDLLIALTTQLIAQDYIITKEGSQGVALTREHLLAFVKVGKEKLAEIEGAQGA